jgi:hypothetical protein
MNEAQKTKEQKPPVPKAEMTWRQPSMWRREYELRVKDQVVALLAQRGILNVETEIFEPDGLGDFYPVLLCRRYGILRQEVHVKLLDPRFPAMKPASLSLGGTARFVLPDGRAFSFGPENFWQTRWLLTTEAGELLAYYTRQTFGRGGEVFLYDHDLEEETYLFLLYLGWYVLIVKLQDAAGAAAAGA